MLPQCITHQCGTILIRPPRGLIRGVQELFIENNLDCFHIRSLLHSILHIRKSTAELPISI